MRRPPSGCTSSGTSEPVSPTRARQIVTRRPCSSARAPMRGRERADPAQAPVRVREIELAVGRADLVGVGDALRRLRPELGLGSGENAVEQLRRHLGRPRVHGAGIVVGRDRERPLGRDRARVELGHRAVDRHPGLRIARQDGPLDRRRPAPPRQERRMDVEPEPAPEQLGRDQEPVRDDHDRPRPDLDLPGEPLGLENGDAEPKRGLLRRRRRRPAAAPARRVGPRQQRDDLMGGGEPLEHVRAERRRRGDGDASHDREANGGASPAGDARAPRAATRRRCARG